MNVTQEQLDVGVQSEKCSEACNGLQSPLCLKHDYPFPPQLQMAAAEEIELLRNQLKAREEQVHQAAQAGLDLLKQQMELQNTLDEQRVEMTNALEVWHCICFSYLYRYKPVQIVSVSCFQV